MPVHKQDPIQMPVHKQDPKQGLELKTTIEDVREKLTKLIFEEAPQEVIFGFEELLEESIDAVADVSSFFELPTENLLRIIQKSKTEDIKIIKKLVSKFSEHKGEEAPLILNVVDTDDASLEEYIEVLSKLRTCPICKRIGDIIERDKTLPNRDYEGEIKELKQKIVQLEEEITKMKSGSKSFNICDKPKKRIMITDSSDDDSSDCEIEIKEMKSGGNITKVVDNSAPIIDIKKFKNVVGIDFGSTKVSVCHYEPESREKYCVFESRLGEKSTPTYVEFTSEGKVSVGRNAKNHRYLDPENIVYDIQRLIGKKKGDKSIDEFFGKAPFKIVYHGNDPFIHIDGDEVYSPEEIAAFILSEVKEIVRMKTGSYPDACVITVPAYFSEPQRAATKLAAEIAELNCIKIISEPTAAILAYKEHYAGFESGKFLVFEYGAITLDVTILEVEEDQCKVLACECNNEIGGERIDSLLYDYCVERFVKKNPGCDPTKYPRVMADLRQKCKEAKEELSSARETKVIIPNFFEGKHIKESITRTNFSWICEDQIISKLSETIDAAFESAGIEPEDIDQLILVGGSSQIPFVTETLYDYFEGKLEPLHAVPAEKAYAIGAAVFFNRMVTEVIE